jgi:hypothetical protein
LEAAQDQISEREVLASVEQLYSPVDPPVATDAPVRSEKLPAATVSNGERGACTDSEWLMLPITTFSPVERFVDSMSQLACRDLFRNKFMNPTDCLIQKTARDRLSHYLDSRREQLGRLLKGIHDVARQELAVLAESGVLRGIKYADYVASLPDDEQRRLREQVERKATELRAELAARGLSEDAIQRNIEMIHVVQPGKMFDFVPFAQRRTGDVYYACRLTDLPSACRAATAFKASAVETFWTLLETFEAAGALDAGQARRLLDRIEQRLDEKFPTAYADSDGSK